MYCPTNTQYQEHLDLDINSLSIVTTICINNDSLSPQKNNVWFVILKTPYNVDYKMGAVKMLIDTKAQRSILSLGSFKTMNKANPNIKLKQTNAVIRSIDKTYIVVEVKK